MVQFILKESVLNNDYITLSDNGKIFKGGYIAIIKQYSFLNAWNNKETVKRFRNEKQLFSFLEKNYPENENLFLINEHLSGFFV